ncbi:hypothetical protein LC653_40410, partial [Nostoc sp. CHAB 5784]|nr:hypothetical protein [Nostoc mirabile CHAB5784]
MKANTQNASAALILVAIFKAEAATDCAKHRNVKAEVTTLKAEAATDCAKHRNVKAEVTTL